MKILVIGGGVAGPVFCLFCRKFGVKAELTLVERAPEFKNIGYGISLWGNGRKILDQLDGIKNIDDKEGYEIPWDAFETTKKHFLMAFVFDIFRKFGPTVTITRSALQKALVEQLSRNDVGVRLGTTVKIIENNSKEVRVEFSDKSVETFDLVVGADGIHSSVREEVFGKNFLKSYGVTAWVMWISEKIGRPVGALGIYSEGKTSMVFPAMENGFMMLASKMPPGNPEAPEVRKEYLHKMFKDFNPWVHSVVDSIENPADILRTELSHVVMEDFYKNRVVLVGDAQHALSPATGMGASFAMEDAFVLAEELSKKDVDSALKGFVKRRKNRIKTVKKLSDRLDGWIYATGLKAFFRDNFAFMIPQSYFLAGFKKILSEEI